MPSARYSSSLATAGNCWQLDAGTVYSSGVPLGNGKLGYMSMNQWCETLVP
jgi:hypothetical protein